MTHSLSLQKIIKRLLTYVLGIGITFLLQLPAQSQTPVQEKVERYLYTCYDASKAGLKENERVLRILEKQLSDFMFKMDKAEAAKMKAHETEFNEFLARVDKLKDVKMLQQLVEESKRSHKLLLANILERGVQSVDEAKECRKAIVFKMVEVELLKLRQEKLIALLKDEESRGRFIHHILNEGNINEQTDLRNLMVAVDKNISTFGI